MKVITVLHSNAIRKVVDDVLAELASTGAVDVVGNGKVAPKAVTVAEIVKRRIDESHGVWYQCNEVAGVIQHAETNDEDEFVALQTSKQRTIPRLTIHLSVAPFDSHGLAVQTNARQERRPDGESNA